VYHYVTKLYSLAACLAEW